MSITRWMDKEDMVHIYNGILLSHKKDQNGVICRDVGTPRVCHTEWSKSEREKKNWILMYMCGIYKNGTWTYLQGRNRDRDIVSGHVDMEGEGGTSWEIRIDMYTLLWVKRIASGEKLLYSTGSSARCSVMAWRGGRGGDICIHIADSLHWTGETNTTMQGNHTSI